MRIERKTRKVQAAGVIVVGDFNEDTHAKIMQELMVEMLLYGALSEFHDVEEKIDKRLSIGKIAQMLW